jgi:polar amino acid transport system substrate-binding protein
MQRVARLRLCMLLLIGACHAAAASVAASAAPAAPPALTAYTVPVAPWTFPADPTHGIAPEFLRYLFDQAQVAVHLDTLPYPRAIDGLRDGSNVAALLIPDAERDLFALRLCEVGQIRSGLVYKTSRFKQLTLADLPGLTIGMQQGTHALDKLLSMQGVRPYTVDSVQQGLRMLQLDRLDATFLSSPGSEGLLSANGLSQRDYGWLQVDAAPVVVYVSRKSPLARNAAAMRRLKAACNGPGQAVMQALMAKYR